MWKEMHIMGDDLVQLTQMGSSRMVFVHQEQINFTNIS